MERRAHEGDEEVERDVGSGIIFKKSNVQGRDAHLRDGRYESNWDSMSHQPRGRNDGRQAISIWGKGAQ